MNAAPGKKAEKADTKIETEAVAAAIDAVSADVTARTGLVLGARRRPDLKASIAKVMGAAGADDPAQWPVLLKTDDALFDKVIADITVGETYFFRDPEHFTYVRETVIPDLRRRKPGQDVVAWSAGCATGEEAYSLAILFDEARIGARIIATDISRPALAKAAQGIYGRWSLRGEGARLIGGHLNPVARDRGEAFELTPRLRGGVHFAHMNLAQGAGTTLFQAGTVDVIFCRNVLIYLNPDTITRIARRFHEALADGGVLITGPSDPLLDHAAPFATETTAAGMIYRKGARREAAASIEPAFLEAPFPEAQLLETHEPDIEPWPPAADTTHSDIDPSGEKAAILAVRAAANRGDMARAAVMAAAAAQAHPAAREIPYLHAILLMNMDRLADADALLKRLIYLDPALAVAHLTLGNLRLRLGDLAGARRAFKAAYKAAAALPAAEIPALSEGETAGQIMAAAARGAGQ